jgi:hypothetical protein
MSTLKQAGLIDKMKFKDAAASYLKLSQQCENSKIVSASGMEFAHINT